MEEKKISNPAPTAWTLPASDEWAVNYASQQRLITILKSIDEDDTDIDIVDPQARSKHEADRKRVGDLLRSAISQHQWQRTPAPTETSLSNQFRTAGINNLWHFTPESNLESIRQTGALVSWLGADLLGINPTRASTDLSSGLDVGSGIPHHVRLFIFYNNATSFKWGKEAESRGDRLYPLRIDIAAIDIPGVKFCEGNAVSTKAEISTSPEKILGYKGLPMIAEYFGQKKRNGSHLDYELFKLLNDITKKFRMSEVLIPWFLPTPFFLDL